jgi:hypothetical protein
MKQSESELTRKFVLDVLDSLRVSIGDLGLGVRLLDEADRRVLMTEVPLDSLLQLIGELDRSVGARLHRKWAHRVRRTGSGQYDHIA